MQDFDYVRPDTLEQAVIALDASDAVLLAGGQTLLPAMKHRLTSFETLIDIARLDQLKGISRDNGVLRIGAAETHANVATSDVVRTAIPALAELTSHIGDPAVRNRGTIGGSLANNDPSTDYPAALLALGGTVHTNMRQIVADDFFQGLFTTALYDGEVIQAVSLPIPTKASYVKHANPASRYALVGVCVAQMHDAVRVAVTGADSDGVFRANAIEDALRADFSESAVQEGSVDSETLISDLHGSGDYRAALITVCTRRAVVAAAS